MEEENYFTISTIYNNSNLNKLFHYSISTSQACNQGGRNMIERN